MPEGLLPIAPRLDPGLAAALVEILKELRENLREEIHESTKRFDAEFDDFRQEALDKVLARVDKLCSDLQQERLEDVRGVIGRMAQYDELVAKITARLAEVQDGKTPTSEEVQIIVEAHLAPHVAELLSIVGAQQEFLSNAEARLANIKDGETPSEELLNEIIQKFLDPIEKGFQAGFGQLESDVREDVRNAVATIEARLAEIKDGEDGKTPTEDEIREVVNDAVGGVVAALNLELTSVRSRASEILALVEARVASLKDGEDGHTPTEEEIRSALSTPFEELAGELRAQVNGLRSKSEDLLSKLENRLATLKDGKDGEDGKGPTEEEGGGR